MASIEEPNRKKITVQQACDRLWAELSYKIAQAEVDFMRMAKGAKWPRCLELVEDHCVARFDVRALAFAFFAKGSKPYEVDSRYTAILHASKEQILRKFEQVVSNLPSEIREESRLRLTQRLNLGIKDWWSLVGLALLDEDPGPFLIASTKTTSEHASQTETEAGMIQHCESAVLEPVGKRGPRKDLDTAKRVFEIVQEIAPDGRWNERLDEIFDALDDAKVPFPKRWRQNGTHGWLGCERKLGKQAIEHRLANARNVLKLTFCQLS